MKALHKVFITVILVHLLCTPSGAAEVEYESVHFKDNDLVVQFTITKFHRNDLAEAVKRRIEG